MQVLFKNNVEIAENVLADGAEKAIIAPISRTALSKELKDLHAVIAESGRLWLASDRGNDYSQQFLLVPNTVKVNAASLEHISIYDTDNDDWKVIRLHNNCETLVVLNENNAISVVLQDHSIIALDTISDYDEKIAFEKIPGRIPIPVWKKEGYRFQEKDFVPIDRTVVLNPDPIN